MIHFFQKHLLPAFALKKTFCYHTRMVGYALGS